MLVPLRHYKIMGSLIYTYGLSRACLKLTFVEEMEVRRRGRRKGIPSVKDRGLEEIYNLMFPLV